MNGSAPLQGVSADQILDIFADSISPYPFGNGHPRFYAWVNSPPTVMGIMAEALAAAINPSVAGGNHSAVWLERQVIEWFKQILGFPSASMGLLVSGGSSAALVGLAVARHVACEKRGIDVRVDGVGAITGRGDVRLRVYKGSEGHSCNQKAVELLGLGSANIVEVPSDKSLRMRVDALDALLTRDIDAGHVPLAVVASAGTVNTGAIDPIAAIADVCERHGVWLHVDGAYGAPAVLASEYSARLSEIERADSLAVDPHKWLYVPVDCGLVLVKNAQAMRNAFSLVPEYLRTDGDRHGVQGPPWFSEFGFEQTRPFRALKLWASLMQFGTAGYARLIEHDIAVARHLAMRVSESTYLESFHPQELSVVCFRAVHPSLTGDEGALETLNRALLVEIQLGGEGFVSSAVIDGRLWLRACVVNPRATFGDVERVLEFVHSRVERLASDVRRGHPGGLPEAAPA